MQNAHRRAFCVGIDWTDKMILHHSNRAVNLQFSQSTQPSAHPLAATLAARLNAGAHERCAACLSWIDRRQTGGVAVYMPHDLRPHVAINGTPAQQNELTRKVENYLDGGAK